MKKIHIVSLGHTTGSALKQQIESFVGEYANVEYSTLSEVNETDLVCDLLVYTSDFGYESAKHIQPDGIDSIVAGRVINHKRLEKLLPFLKEHRYF